MNLIKEIHSSFTKAQEALIAEADVIISEIQNKEKIEKLAKLGFINCANVKSLAPDEIEKAKKLKELVNIYSVIAPLYKFITEEKRIELCKKYGIVMADLKRFTGRIPSKNMDDILSFKINNTSFLAEKKDISNKALIKKGLLWQQNVFNGLVSILVSEMETSHLYNTLDFLLRGKKREEITAKTRANYINTICYVLNQRDPEGFAACGNIRKLTENEAIVASIGCYDSSGFYKADLKKDPYDLENYIVEDPQMFIVSDISQLDTNKALIDDDMYLSEEFFKKEEEKKRRLLMERDPLVLCKVKGGYLIVTAWGDEASDISVINQINN